LSDTAKLRDTAQAPVDADASSTSNGTTAGATSATSVAGAAGTNGSALEANGKAADAPQAPDASGNGTPTRRRPRGEGLSAMLLPELKAMAGSLGISGITGMRKGHLVAAIEAARGSSSDSRGSATGAASMSASATAPAPTETPALPLEQPAADRSSAPVAPYTPPASDAGGQADAPGPVASEAAPAADANGDGPPGRRRRRGSSRPAGSGSVPPEDVGASTASAGGLTAASAAGVDGVDGAAVMDNGATVSPQGSPGDGDATTPIADSTTIQGADENATQGAPDAARQGDRQARQRSDRQDSRGEQADRQNGQADRQNGQARQQERADRPGTDRQDRQDRPGNDRQNGDRQNGDRQRQGQGGQSQGNQGQGQGSQGQGSQGQGGNQQGQFDDADGNRRGRFRERGRGRNRTRAQGGSVNEPDLTIRDDDVLTPIGGILDIHDNYAFVRTTGYLTGPNDVYVSMSQVRKMGLRRGDAITGAVRQPEDAGAPGERRDKYNALVRLDTVNGLTPEEAKERPEFHNLIPLYPNERLRLETEPQLVTTRVIDLVMPLGKGQRALIVSPPKAGKTMVLQSIANAITTNNPECHLMVVLVDERPEEVTDMQRSVKGEVIASTFDRPPADHTVVAELSIERAKRLVELGHDVVVLLDSITRLGRAYNLAAPASGRILSGGVDSTALYPPKRFLGAARNIENGGSLTILATALVETGSTMDTVIFEEFKGTGNAELVLSRKIADKRIFPAVDVDASGTRKEEILLSPDELVIVYKLRRVLHALDPLQGIELLLDRLKKTRTNYEFLMQIAKTTPNEDDR